MSAYEHFMINEILWNLSVDLFYVLYSAAALGDDRLMEVMEVTSTSFSLQMAASFTTFLCWASTQKTETLDIVKLFLWKGNTAAQSGFEFMRRFYVFLLLDGSSHHLFSSPLNSGLNCCSLWHQHIFIICQMWLWWLSPCLWLGLIVVCVSRLFIF